MHLPDPVAPIAPENEMRPLAELLETLARIDGWGPRAWREVLGAWRMPSCDLGIEEREGPPCEEGGEVVCTIRWNAPRWIGSTSLSHRAAADWLLRRARSELIPDLGLDAWTLDPGEWVRATNASFVITGDLFLRFSLRLPFAGMCIDGERFARAIGRIGRFTRATAAAQPGLAAHRRSLAVQGALRDALPAHGLVAFVAAGSLLARDPAGGVDPSCRPLRVPKQLTVTINLGRLGRHRGLGIRSGVTAIAGAPYHGKSTLLAAIAGGGEDRPPADGRERVVSIASLMPVLADDGRPITAQDMTPFFPRLPGGMARSFTTRRASGSTSMAAAVLQSIAAGVRLLLVDEDTAAANFLSLQPAMLRLLGRDLHGARTLAEVLPDLSRQGISTIVVAGASTAAIASADRTVLMRDFAPQDATAAARRACGRQRRAASIRLPARRLAGDPDAILGHGHALRIDADDPERPSTPTFRVDLRRSGMQLDAWLARGAVLGAAWCTRLADGGCPMDELGQRYVAWLAERGPVALDPFHDGFHAVAPWPLVAAVLERIPGVGME
ncbi:MAG: P-loop domain-containing protein [Planctomycetota bacterium]